MSRYSDQIRDEYGRAVPGVSVYVYKWDANAQVAGDLEVLTDDASAPLANPLTSDADGLWYFNSVDGQKLLEYHYGGKVEERQIILVGALPVPQAVFGGLFVDASALSIPVGMNMIGTTGYSVVGVGAANYIYDAAVHAAYVVANPRSSFISANLRGFRLDHEQDINPQMFGAKSDGVTHDAAAIQAAWNFAFANSIPCHNPGGNYALEASLTIDSDGWQLTGDGWENTRFIPTGAFPAIIVKGRFGKATGIGCWGNGVGTYGWIFKNAGGCEIVSCQGREFTIDGALLDPTYGGGAAGNNNCLKFRAGGYNANRGCGIRMIQWIDNNNVGFLGVEASANVSHGLLAKSSKPHVDPDCIFEGNGGYGVQLGEDADGSTNLDAKVDEPWIEANTLGGVRGSASSSNGTVNLMSQGQGYTRNASALNSVAISTGGGLYWFGSVDGVAFVQANASAADAFLKAASASAGNVNLSLSGAGTGYLGFLGRTQLVDDGDTFAEFNIRPAAAKTGVLTFTHEGVADRWGIGIKTGDGTLYFGNRDLSATVTSLSSAGVFAAASYNIGANQVVGARQTGWTADTGTAKKTANATYAAGTTLTYSAAYVQAEQTAMATRMAAVEAALQDATQTIKALKDERLAAGSIGA